MALASCVYRQNCDPQHVMAVRDVYNLWLGNGGSADRAVEMVAVAQAESCLDPEAQSQTCAAGLWQIEYFHAGPRGLTYAQLFDVRVNAGIAVELSANGLNFAAFDTAYAAGESLTRVDFLGYPEKFSNAWYAIGRVAATLGVPDPRPDVTAPGGAPTFAPIASTPVPPTETLPPGVGSAFVPPFPAYVAPVQLPPAAQLRSDGFDNTRAWYNDDIPYLLSYDNYILEHLIRS